MRGRPNIKTIHPCSETCGKKLWYERTFSKTRFTVLLKCSEINCKWWSNSSGQKWVPIPQMRGCWIGGSLINEEVLWLNFNYWFLSAIYFKQCDNGCHIHLSACNNLNCDWFYQVTLSMYRKLQILAHWHQIQVLSNNNW